MNASRKNSQPQFEAQDIAAAPELETLLTKARAFSPSATQLVRMCRAVRAEARTPSRRIWKIVGALVTAGAAIVGTLLVLAPPEQPRAFALSQVAEAMKAVPVVKHTTNRGDTSWESRGRFYAWRYADGKRAWYWDMQKEQYATYDADRGCIMISTCERLTLPHGMTGALTLDELVTEAESWGTSFDDRWIRSDFESNGQPRVELIAKKQGPVRPSKIIIDASTGRILRTEGDGDWWCRYSYPDSPPRDIYDLSVPRDTPVVDGTASTQLLDLREKVLAAMKAGFGAYRMVSLHTVSGSGMYRVITDGRRYRVENAYASPTPNWTVDQMRELAQKHITLEPLNAGPRVVGIFDGQSEISVHFDAENKLKYCYVRPEGSERFRVHTLEIRTRGRSEGFFFPWADRQDEYIGPNERGWVGIRIRGQANNVSRPYLRDTWFDPRHGYRPTGGRSLDFPDAPWQLKADWQAKYHGFSPLADAPARGSVTERVEWAELREGQWYQTLRTSRRVERDQDGVWRQRKESGNDDFRSVVHRYILAQPLEQVDDKWFEIPPEWLAIPARSYP